VLSAHAANELSVLMKLFVLCARHNGKTEMEREAINAQAMAIGRILTGKLYECWKLLCSAFFRTQLSKIYEPKFDEEGKVALKSLKQYFGRKNLIETVRNRHAFHYSNDQISQGYTNLSGDEALNIYLSKTNTNTLFAFADKIANYSLVEDINPGKPSDAFDLLIRETSKVTRWLYEVIAECIVIAIKSHVSEDLAALGMVDLELGEASDWRSIAIPYFVEIADDEVT